MKRKGNQNKKRRIFGKVFLFVLLGCFSETSSPLRCQKN